MDIPDGVEIHPGDNWIVRPFPVSSIEAEDSPLRSAGFADVIIRKGTKPHYRTSHSFLYQVVEGQGYVILGEHNGAGQIVRWHARLIRPEMLLSIDAGELHFFFTGEEDLHLQFVGSLSQCLQHDRVDVPLEELEKPMVLHIRGKVLGYEGTIANLELEDGTLADLHDANKRFGVEKDFEPGQVVLVDFHIDWLGAKARKAAEEAETTIEPPQGE